MRKIILSEEYLKTENYQKISENFMSLISRKEYLEIYNIVGAAMEVHKELGGHLEEAIYQYAMREELSLRHIPFEAEKLISVFYKGVRLQPFFKADFICYDNVVVEFKSVEKLTSEHRSQLFNYMRLLDGNRGVLINFGCSSLITERFVLDYDKDKMILLTKENLDDMVEK